MATASNTANGSIDANGDTRGSLVVGLTSQGVEMRATLLRMTRYSVVFEIYSPGVILRVSEVLDGFKIIVEGQALYAGRAVLRSIIDTGPIAVCEATLEDSWLDVDFFPPDEWKNRLREDFSKFMAATHKTFRILPEFKVAVADLQMLLMNLRMWLEQVEVGVRSQPAGNRHEIEREAILSIQGAIVQAADQVLEHFERTAQQVEPDARAVHMNYMKRQIHPLVLCSPFIHRTFYKPLGYAGDYEMVNMMVRDPYEGGSLFAKLANRIFLDTPPVEAHRNRLTHLTQLLRNEILRTARLQRTPHIFNMGCGPAKEIHDLLVQYDVGPVQFSLVDFNDETLSYVSRTLTAVRNEYNRPAQIRLTKRSVHQLIKEAFKFQSDSTKYDMVYCAGLFDYLSDSVCKRLMNLLYELVVPGGLLVVTNVNDTNPSRNWMEYVLDWYLVYRNPRQLAGLTPALVDPEGVAVRAVGTGVNILLEIRKPENA